MIQYTLEITEEALADMEQLYQHIALNLQSPENAMGQYNHIAAAILKLDMLPDRFRIMDLELEHSKGIRRMLVDNYLVFYVVQGETVTVTDVLYNKTTNKNNNIREGVDDMSSILPVSDLRNQGLILL